MNEIQKKRIEEAARKYSESCRPDESLYGLGVQLGYLQGFLKGSEYALTHQWIRVDEALPEYEEAVLVTDRAGEGHGIYFNHRSDDPDVKTYENGFCNLFGEEGEVVAWMPVPEFETKDVK